MPFTPITSLQIHPISTSLKIIDRFIAFCSFSAGECQVCGKKTIFHHFTENLRESGLCSNCNSSNRQRQIASALLGVVYETKGTSFSNINELVSSLSKYSVLSDFKIYNTETTGSLHNVLKQLNNYYASEYLGDEYESGKIINGITHQNLMKTSFENSSLDLVISSDVFEHIPDPYVAFAEIHRILKPGGRHIFTVPFYCDRYKDEIRATIESEGILNHILPPIYHGDPIRSEGILVYVIFSIEMLVKLDNMGYQVRIYNLRNPLKGILGNNAIVFDTIKNN